MLETGGSALGDDAAASERWDADPRGVVASAVAEAIDAVRTLGNAELGDKTMLDALVPFREALTAAVGPGQDLGAAWRAAAARATEGLRPRVGRARPLAERSLGSPDPGAVSLALIATATSNPAPGRPENPLPEEMP